jgi:hypothetical protein
MFERKRFMAPEAGDAGGGGGDATAILAEPPAAAAADPAAAPPTAQVVESLLSKPPATAAVPPVAGAVVPPADGAPAWLVKVPEKFHVKTADGKYDAEATMAKQAESYTHLEKLRGPQPPATASDYKFVAPEAFKDIKLDDALSASFRERAHKAGMSQDQYQMAVEAHLEMMPGVLDATLKLAANECRAELQKVWAAPHEFEAGLADAQRAVNGAPAAMRDDVWARFGRDPAFIQFAASMGKEMREDKPGNPGQATTGAADQSGVEALMASEAYRNPKHPDHAGTTARVQAFWKRAYGDNPAN